jgi:hypothetical protein
MKNNCIIVLGMHRSGTSALAGLLGQLGADPGLTLLPPNDADNPKGYWEHAEIVDIHEQLLQTFDSSWDDVKPLPEKWWKSTEAGVFKATILGVLRRDFASSPVWILKDPRMCRLLPLWLEIFEELHCRPRFVISLRHPTEVALSLSKRLGFFEPRSSLLWLEHLLEAEKWSRDCHRTVVVYDRLLSDWCTEVIRISSELSLPLRMDNDERQNQTASFIEPSLQHHKAMMSHESRSDPITALAVRCYELLSTGDHLDNSALELDSMRAVVTDLASSIAPWDRENQALNETKAELIENNSKLAGEIERLKNTISWRATKPFRFAYNKLRKL